MSEKPIAKIIKLSKQLHKHGVRVEIKEGMWVLNEVDKLSIVSFMPAPDLAHLDEKDWPITTKMLTPILDFEDAARELEERGWYSIEFISREKGTWTKDTKYICIVKKYGQYTPEHCYGATRVQAMLSCLHEIIKRENNNE